jgi:hypothetical protein
MRLGDGQTSTFVAGISGTPLRGSQLVVTASGQLGILASSARYKRDIEDMGAQSGAVPVASSDFSLQAGP